MKVVRLSALCTDCPYLQEIFLVLISVGSWVNSRATVWPEGLCQSKIPMTQSGIKPATFWLVAQCFNQLCYCMLPLSYKRCVTHDFYSYHFITQNLWNGVYGNLKHTDKVLWNSCQGVMPTSTGFAHTTQFSLTTNFIWMQYDLIFFFLILFFEGSRNCFCLKWKLKQDM